MNVIPIFEFVGGLFLAGITFYFLAITIGAIHGMFSLGSIFFGFMMTMFTATPTVILFSECAFSLFIDIVVMIIIFNDYCFRSFIH